MRQSEVETIRKQIKEARDNQLRASIQEQLSQEEPHILSKKEKRKLEHQPSSFKKASKFFIYGTIKIL